MLVINNVLEKYLALPTQWKREHTDLELMSTYKIFMEDPTSLAEYWVGLVTFG